MTPRVERLDPEARQIAFEEGELVCQENQLRFQDEEPLSLTKLEYAHFFDDDMTLVPNISLNKE